MQPEAVRGPMYLYMMARRADATPLQVLGTNRPLAFLGVLDDSQDNDNYHQAEYEDYQARKEQKKSVHHFFPSVTRKPLSALRLAGVLR